MEATESDSVEPTHTTEKPEKATGSEHPFVEGKSLRQPSSIEMSIDNGKRKVQILPSQSPKKHFIAIDKNTGDEIELSEEGDRSIAINLIRDNPFRR